MGNRVPMRALVGVLALGVVTATGCATDPYGVPRVSQNQAVGGLIGGLTGAAVGYNVGKGSHHKDRGALIGGLTGALVGGWLGGRLDQYDRRYAAPAYFTAFDDAPYGSTVSWSNPQSGHYGSVTPLRGYDRGGSTCREFSQRVVIGGLTETAHGTACRDASGAWRLVE